MVERLRPISLRGTIVFCHQSRQNVTSFFVEMSIAVSEVVLSFAPNRNRTEHGLGNARGLEQVFALAPQVVQLVGRCRGGGQSRADHSRTLYT